MSLSIIKVSLDDLRDLNVDINYVRKQHVQHGCLVGLEVGMQFLHFSLVVSRVAAVTLAVQLSSLGSH